MKGTYRINDRNIDNVITDEGRSLLLEFLAGNIDSWAGAVAVGASQDAPSVANTRLGFEFGRAPITVSTSVATDDAIIVKGTIPRSVTGEIYELGVFSHYLNPTTTSPAGLITDFDYTLLAYTGGIGVDGGRIGERSITLSPTAAVDAALLLESMSTNFELYSDGDQFILAVDATTAGSIQVILRASATDYFTVTIPVIQGYNTYFWPKQDFVAVGAVNWTQNFTSLEFVASTDSVGTDMVFDGFRIEDSEQFETYGLVSRAVLTEPIVKDATSELDVEYKIRMNW